MFDFLARLFDTSDFSPRWDCGIWTPAHGWLHILSDLGIWSAYVAIPCVIGYFVLRRRDVPFRTVFLPLRRASSSPAAPPISWRPSSSGGPRTGSLASSSWRRPSFPGRPSSPWCRSCRKASRMRLGRRVQAASSRGPQERRDPELQRNNADLERRVAERTRELTRAVAAIAAERELLRTTLGSIGDGVIVTDLDGRTTFLNPIAEKLTGWSTSEAKGRPLGDVFRIVNEQTREPLSNPADRAACRQDDSPTLESHTILTSPGTAARRRSTTAPRRSATTAAASAGPSSSSATSPTAADRSANSRGANASSACSPIRFRSSPGWPIRTAASSGTTAAGTSTPAPPSTTSRAGAGRKSTTRIGCRPSSTSSAPTWRAASRGRTRSRSAATTASSAGTSAGRWPSRTRPARSSAGSAPTPTSPRASTPFSSSAKARSSSARSSTTPPTSSPGSIRSCATPSSAPSSNACRADDRRSFSARRSRRSASQKTSAGSSASGVTRPSGRAGPSRSSSPTTAPASSSSRRSFPRPVKGASSARSWS